MPADQWVPPQTGDRILDRSFADLASRLAGMDATLAELSVPAVRVVRASAQIGDEIYIEYRGPGGHVITLPPASTRGTGRGALVTVQNSGLGAITVRSFAQDALNDGTEVTLPVDSGALSSSNGVDRWTSLVSGSSLIIQNHGTDQSPQRSRLNFTGDIVVTDNPGNGSTDVDVTVILPSFPYDPAVYYVPGLPNPNAGALTFSVNTAQDFLTAIPHIFDQAGTIDYMAQHFSGQGGSGRKVWHAIYRDAGGIPGTRVFDHEYASITNFAGSKYETAVGVSVDAGEIIWFASVHNVNNNPQQLAVVSSEFRNLLGTSYDGTGNTNPTRDRYVGYRVSFSYAQPPATWSGTTKTIAGTTDIPTPLFKFTPA